MLRHQEPVDAPEAPEGAEDAVADAVEEQPAAEAEAEAEAADPVADADPVATEEAAEVPATDPAVADGRDEPAEAEPAEPAEPESKESEEVNEKEVVEVVDDDEAGAFCISSMILYDLFLVFIYFGSTEDKDERSTAQEIAWYMFWLAATE